MDAFSMMWFMWPLVFIFSDLVPYHFQFVSAQGVSRHARNLNTYLLTILAHGRYKVRRKFLGLRIQNSTVPNIHVMHFVGLEYVPNPQVKLIHARHVMPLVYPMRLHPPQFPGLL